MKILVTGGGGFIGSHLIERLVRAGHDTRVLDNFSTGRRENIAPWSSEVEIVEGDITSYERAHVAVQGCEVVLHQAALPSVPRSIQDPLTSSAVNVTGTLNLLLAARDAGVRRFVSASSSSVYGANPTLPKREDMTPLPMSPYAVAKLAAEGYCRSFWQVYGLETVALRYFNVYGPRQDPESQYAAVLPNFAAALLAGRSPTIHGDGEQSRDFTYVASVVDANLAAMNAPGVEGEAINVATGSRVTINELFRRLRELIGSDVEPVHEPARPGDVPHSLADVVKARDLLGYQPVELEQGLEATVAFYREHADRGTIGVGVP